MENGDAAAVVAAVEECVERSVWSLPDTALLQRMDLLQRAQCQLDAARLAVVRELDGRDLARREGATSLPVFLRDRYQLSIYTANRLVNLARALDVRLPATREALAGGAVHAAQAWVIKEALDRLPTTLDPDLVAEAEAALVEQAGRLDPPALRAVGARILHHVAPEIAEEHERRVLEEQTREARRRRKLKFIPDGHGGVRITGVLDEEAAAFVQAGIDAIAAPRNRRSGNRNPGSDGLGNDAGRSANGDLVGDGAGGERSNGINGLDGAGDDGWPAVDRVGGGEGEGWDGRTVGQRRADALHEIVAMAFASERLPDHGGDRPSLVVTVDYDTVTRQLGIGTLDSGERLDPSVVRRLACDAKLIPGVLDGRGQPLDLGRERRLFGGAVRRALALRDGGCSFPGCDRPPKWCEAHHVLPWEEDGPTCLSNGCLLCVRHHHLIHEGEWQVRIATDGMPEFIPPAWIDPWQRPRRNHRPRRVSALSMPDGG